MVARVAVKERKQDVASPGVDNLVNGGSMKGSFG
jgi:hypothetical protein